MVELSWSRQQQMGAAGGSRRKPESLTLVEYKRETGQIATPFVVAIDPGVNTGMAIYRDLDKFLDFNTTTFWGAYDYITTTFQNYGVTILIETPNSKRQVYAHLDGKQGDGQRGRIASNIGANRREATLLADRFEDLGFCVHRMTPNTRKWSADDLKRHTGIDKRTSQHVRDAIKLLFIKNVL